MQTVTVGFASNFVAADYGADGPGTTAYALVLEAEGSASGMYALDNSDTETVNDGYGQGAEILLFSEPDGSVTGRTVDGGAVYFTISVNGSGQVTFTQSQNVWHSDTDTDDNSSGLSAAAETLQLQQTVTDGDGDSDTALIDLSDGVFFIEDDGPEIHEFTDAVGDNVGPNPSAEGIFDFDIGTDAPNGGHDDIFIDPDSVVISINGVALDPTDVTFGEAPSGEDEHTAEYEFSFEYATGAGTTDTINGTLIFYKDASVVGHDAGTYEVVLDDTVQGFSILQTATGTDFTGYDLNTANETGSQPDVAVTQLRGDPDNPDPTDLFIQFTSIAEPSSGTGANNLFTTGYALTGDPDGNGVANTFANGELFTQEAGWVSASGSENGVNGDTVGGGEVLDFNLYMGDNPEGFVGGEPTASATTMFLKFDGITDDADNSGNGEDLIVILKLYDPITDTYTTKALMVQNTDIQKGPGTGPGQFSGITLDNNDGLIVIEPNDYQEGNTNLVIVGAQIADGDEGIVGTGINFNNATGAGGASSGTEAFSTDNNDGPLKITSIGFVTQDTSDQSVTIDFDVTVTDADGDSETTALNVQIGDPPAFALSAATSFLSNSQEEQLQKTAANSNTLTLATAVAAAGLVEPVAAHDNGNHNGHGQNSDQASFAAPEVVERYSASDDGGDAAVSMLAPEASTEASAPADTFEQQLVGQCECQQQPRRQCGPGRAGIERRSGGRRWWCEQLRRCGWSGCADGCDGFGRSARGSCQRQWQCPAGRLGRADRRRCLASRRCFGPRRGARQPTWRKRRTSGDCPSGKPGRRGRVGMAHGRPWGYRRRVRHDVQDGCFHAPSGRSSAGRKRLTGAGPSLWTGRAYPMTRRGKT